MEVRTAEQGQIPSVSADSIMLLVICLLDAIITVALVVAGLATEANPLLQWCLDAHVILFYLAKTIPLIALISLAEWHRKKNPVFVRRALRFGIAAYLIIYFTGIMGVNLIQ